MAPNVQVCDLLVQRDGDTLAMSGSGAFATNKDIGAYHLRTMLKAANADDIETAVQFIQGSLHALIHLLFPDLTRTVLARAIAPTACVPQPSLRGWLPVMIYSLCCRRS